MLQEELPKPIKRALRSLSHQAHEAELRRALSELSRHFDRWKAGEIDSFELSDRIHEFHDGPNREAYLRYNSRLDLRFLVGRALREGLIERESVPREVLPYLGDTIEPESRSS